MIKIRKDAWRFVMYLIKKLFCTVLTLSAGSLCAYYSSLVDEFKVNQDVQGEQRGYVYSYQYSAVGTDSNCALVYSSEEGDGSGLCINLQRFASNGSLIGDTILVNQTFSGDQNLPVVDIASNGDLFVVWMGQGIEDPIGISGRWFSSDGTAITDEFHVNVPLGLSNTQTTVSIGGNGNSIVAWASQNQDYTDGNRGIYARLYDSDRNDVKGVFLVNSYVFGDQRRPMVAMDGVGGFVVTWMGYGSSGSSHDVFLKRYDSDGVALTGDVRVNSYYLGRQNFQSIAMASDGRFVVVWQAEELGVGPDHDVYAQLYNADGTTNGANFLVNTYTDGDEFYPMVAMDDSGNFTVVWQATGHPLDSNSCIIAQRFDSTGSRIGCEFRVNSYTDGVQEIGTVACSPSGDHWLSAWVSQGQDGSGRGVFAQILDPYQASPDSATVCDGDEVVLTAPALAQEVTYQWMLDGTEIDGATSHTLTLSGFQQSQAGDYTCRVQGTCGTDAVESLSSIVTFQPLTGISTQPLPFSGTEGDDLPLSIEVVGDVISYQWQCDGVDLVDDSRISGAQSASLSITGLITTDSGQYRCVVETPCGSVESDESSVFVAVSRVDLWMTY